MLKKPTIGMRVIKTAIATSLVAIVYFLIGRNPTFDCSGAVFGMDNYTPSSRNTVGNRSTGTILGAILGTLCYIAAMHFSDPVGKTVVIFFGVIGLIVVAQIFNAAGAIQSGSVMFFILMLNTPAETYAAYAINRVIDTIIGELAAFSINYIIPPYHRPTISQVLLDR